MFERLEKCKVVIELFKKREDLFFSVDWFQYKINPLQASFMYKIDNGNYVQIVISTNSGIQFYIAEGDRYEHSYYVSSIEEVLNLSPSEIKKFFIYNLELFS